MKRIMLLMSFIVLVGLATPSFANQTLIGNVTKLGSLGAYNTANVLLNITVKDLNTGTTLTCFATQYNTGVGIDWNPVITIAAMGKTANVPIKLTCDDSLQLLGTSFPN